MTLSDAIRPLAVATVLVALFTFFFVFPSQDPKPNQLPIGMVSELTAFGTPGAFEIKRFDDGAAARRAIEGAAAPA